jgi:hypothetical protein
MSASGILLGMKSIALVLAKSLAVCSAIGLASFYIWHTHRTANDEVYTIDLNLAPEVNEFEGFNNYGSPIDSTRTDKLGNPTTIILGTKSIPHPVFSTLKPVPPAQSDPNLAIDPFSSTAVLSQRRAEQTIRGLTEAPLWDSLGRTQMSGSKSAQIRLPPLGPVKP